MSVSNWYNPLTITENPAEDSKLISWKTPLKFPLLSAKDLIHLSGTGGPGPSMTDLKNKTTALVFTDFSIDAPTGDLTGVELKLDIDRAGRIGDADVFLVYNGEIIGVNKTDYSQDEAAHLLNFNKNLYGGADDLWGADITPEMLTDSSFGVWLRMQSHPFFPHRSGIKISQVSLRYYFA